VLRMATGPKRPRPSFAQTLREGWKPPSRRAREAGAEPPAAAKGKGIVRKKPKRKAPGSANGGAPRVAVPEPALLKRRESLAHEFAELQWDLGGMAYEMASRDHYRLDVLNKQAARLQHVDAELGQVERMLKMDEKGAAGTCPSCGALQARGAVFCWQCGNELKPPTSPGTADKVDTAAEADEPATETGTATPSE
jgi:hypothetical protein